MEICNQSISDDSCCVQVSALDSFAVCTWCVLLQVPDSDIISQVDGVVDLAGSFASSVVWNLSRGVLQQDKGEGKSDDDRFHGFNSRAIKSKLDA